MALEPRPSCPWAPFELPLQPPPPDRAALLLSCCSYGYYCCRIGSFWASRRSGPAVRLERETESLLPVGS